MRIDERSRIGRSEMTHAEITRWDVLTSIAFPFDGPAPQKQKGRANPAFSQRFDG